MDSVETAQRRRVVICDGPVRHDVAASADSALGAVLRHLGIDPSAVTLHDRAGSALDLARPLGDCEDGTVLTVVDPSATTTPRRQRARAAAASTPHEHIPAVLAVFAVLLVALTPLTTRASTPLTAALGAVAAIGAVVGGVVWARRTPGDDVELSGGFFASPVLVLAAGLLVAPSLAWGSVHVAVICAATAVAVLSGVLALVAAGRVVAAAYATVAVLGAGLAVLWTIILLLSMPASAACAVALGLTPLVLRLLPSTALNAAPGMFIDFVRFQTLRWSVREREPEPAHAVRAAQARTMVAQSAARWRVGAIITCLTAAASAPFALVPLAGDPVVFAGQIALAACGTIALALQSRRALDPMVRWMPRAAAAVVVLSLVAAALGGVGAELVLAGAVVLLVGGVVIAAVTVPVGRGARSLRWSRVGDMLESLTVALALPAGLLAAGFIDLLRGMMA
ncbi:hypothetical protein [Microbacterium sp. KR10-403]|uniref:hypothetical protein n=1 Tax=Microbacterium sp. KR10-403 TaxID=3158581 RepID=UPI0032E3A767